MKVTVLGCGSSPGVPLIGGDWGICDPAEPRNRRTRPSILIETDGKRVLVDTGPDLRQQLLSVGVGAVDAIVYTHHHADHTHGIDELRTLYWNRGHTPVPVYAEKRTLEVLNKRFSYLMPGGERNEEFYKVIVEPHEIEPFRDFEAGGVGFRPFRQDHVSCLTLGLRVGDFAYSTDVKYLPEESFEAIAGIKAWILDAVRPDKPHPTHAILPEALAWIERVAPERAWLTHLSQFMDYRSLMATLPKGVEPAYDGLAIEV
jgi:phosphoribosyl 1,2-cyclic phosphate phosphodiesterase